MEKFLKVLDAFIRIIYSIFSSLLPPNMFFWIKNSHNLSIIIILVKYKLYNFPRSVRFV